MVIPVAFDLRDPLRSGIARVARNLAREFASQSRGRFRITLAGPVDQLEQLNVREWGSDVADLLPWDAGRYSPRAELSWPSVRKGAGDAIWYFPHWDVPWLLSPRRYVVTVHDLAHLTLDLGRTKRVIARSWIHRATSRARRIITGSNYTRTELAAHWPDLSKKVDVVRYGVDERFFAPPPALPGVILDQLPPETSAVMLSVGNLKTYKNLIMGPEVLSRLPDMRWVVVGEFFDDWLQVEERASALGVRDRMIVLGRQPDDVLHALYHRAACLFFPSLHEGYGLPVLEAFACGTPVVAGDAPATLEIMGDAGIVCRGNDANAFASAVSAARANGRRDSDTLRARARLFSWSSAGQRLSQIMQEVHEATRAR